ncbi:MFS transporter [Asticcacaulis sp.]|uniref:MFS transporter n=1 Tax=Asticcacaulis sp. TaxID=1872648 RepID=UPI0026313E4F|nr:MFS transporter [Asticcacaulis sp.]
MNLANVPSPSRQKLAYGLASFGKALLWNASSLLFIFFLTEAVGLAPDVAGSIIGASLVLNAVADLVIGRLMTRFVSRAAAAARAQFYGSLLAGLCFVLFAYAGRVPQEARLVYTITALMAFRIAYALYDVPHNTYFALASSSDSDRFGLASIRYIASGAATLFLTGVTASWVRHTGLHHMGKISAVSGPDFFLISLALVTLSCGFAFLLSRHHAGEVIASPHTPAPAAPLTLTAGAGPSPAYLYLIAAMVCVSATGPFFDKLEPYFTAYAAPDAVSALGFMTFVALGKLLSQPLWAWLTRRQAPEALYTLAALFLAAACVAFFTLSRLTPPLTLSIGLLYGAAGGGVSMYTWGLFAKAVAFDAAQATKWFGLFTFGAKLAQAAAVYAVGIGLERIPYRATGQGADAIVALMVLPSLAGALAVALISLRLRRVTLQSPSP